MSGVQADFSGAFKKTQGLLNIPKATRYELTRFGDDVVKALKMSAKGRSYRFTGERRKTGTGALGRSTDKKLETMNNFYKLTVGTGLSRFPFANKMAEKYARIQDKGGTTRPTVTKRMRGWAWYMFYKTKDEKYKGIALTKKSRLTVRIPGSAWFTSVWEHKAAFLKTSYLNDRVILATAQRMSGGSNA